MLSVVVRLLCLMGWLIKLLAWAAATGTCCSIWSSETALVHQLLSNAATVGVLARTPRLRRVLLQVSFVRDIGPPMTYILHQQRGIETLEKMSAMKTNLVTIADYCCCNSRSEASSRTVGVPVFNVDIVVFTVGRQVSPNWR